VISTLVTLLVGLAILPPPPGSEKEGSLEPPGLCRHLQAATLAEQELLGEVGIIRRSA